LIIAQGAEGGGHTGDIWAFVLFAARAKDAVRSRVRTGKPVRMTRSRLS
jgi:NAD(P)H-dependent flavin oxidoreductase YrpB (nitropropane dioxygenase family)